MAKQKKPVVSGQTIISTSSVRRKDRAHVRSKEKSGPPSDFPANLGKPAIRALQGAGYTTLKQLGKTIKNEIAKLHGIGPNALAKIQQALTESGLANWR